MLPCVLGDKGEGQHCEHHTYPVIWDWLNPSLWKLLCLLQLLFCFAVILFWRSSRGGSGTRCTHMLSAGLTCGLLPCSLGCLYFLCKLVSGAVLYGRAALRAVLREHPLLPHTAMALGAVGHPRRGSFPCCGCSFPAGFVFSELKLVWELLLQL